MKIVITGVHFSPAYAVAEKLKKNWKILFIVRKYVFEGEETFSFEYQVLKKKDIYFETIDTARLQRRITRFTIPSILKFPQGIIDSYKILQKFRPDLILVFGGYISIPVAISGMFQRIPIVVHEQTQGAGISNRIISLIARKVCISYTSSKKYFAREKVILTGNPIREEVKRIIKSIDVQKGLPIIYVTGGSAGAHFINQSILKILRALVSKYVVIHQSGDSKDFRDYQVLSQERELLPKKQKIRYILRKHILTDEIGWVLKNSTLVIGRSGINTVTELLSLGKPAILIPLSHGQTQEQIENAKLYKDTLLGEYIEEKDVEENILLSKIQYMVEHQDEYLKNIKNAKKYVVEDSVSRILNVIQSVYEEDKKKT